MSWNSEFASHWHIFLDTVDTRVRNELQTKDRLGVVTINTIVYTELSKWEVPINQNGAWLNRLQQEHPELGNEFYSLLDKLRLSGSIYFEPPPQEIRGILAGLSLLLMALYSLWRKLSFNQLTTNLSLLAIIFFLLNKFVWPFYRQRKTEMLINQLRDELAKTEQKLQEIASRADNLKSSTNHR